VTITKEIISFSFADGNQNQIDYIPLPVSEVEFVKEMDDIAGDKRNIHEDRCRLQIATLNNGYNSGRSYYLATNSKEELNRLISIISKNAAAAKERAEARTVFRKMQLQIRMRYESNLFQIWMALMIGAVSVHIAAA